MLIFGIGHRTGKWPKNVYTKFPDSDSILTSFAYSYFEELMRSTTSEYEMPFLNKDGEKNKFKVGMGLIRLAKDENAEKPEYIKLLDSAKSIINMCVKSS